jgi:hypothetical protein
MGPGGYKPVTLLRDEEEKDVGMCKSLSLGWLMGIEPKTTGITIRIKWYFSVLIAIPENL